MPARVTDEETEPLVVDGEHVEEVAAHVERARAGLVATARREPVAGRVLAGKRVALQEVERVGHPRLRPEFTGDVLELGDDAAVIERPRVDTEPAVRTSADPDPHRGAAHWLTGGQGDHRWMPFTWDRLEILVDRLPPGIERARACQLLRRHLEDPERGRIVGRDPAACVHHQHPGQLSLDEERGNVGGHRTRRRAGRGLLEYRFGHRVDCTALGQLGTLSGSDAR